MKFVRSRRGIAAIVALVLILFLFRPGVYQLRNRIATSIGSALGRRVAIDNVRFRILPRPGFDLEGLVIYDDPAFSAEPVIRSQDVTAAIRLGSLLRGRLEIATLSASEPSINLVRNNNGRWNLASLIERNAQIPAAPTQKAMSERRPAFPYLEATHARINFKIGQEKKSYSLIDADVALWQDSENSWGARMKAQPVRTDFNLTDTGLLQVNGTWQRAPHLHLTPLKLTITWRNGQLGQITKLLTGRDRGWRGEVDFTGNVSGTPEALAVETRMAIGAFRRYDILDNRIVNLVTACTGRYSAITQSLADLLCESPVGSGIIRLQGNIGAVETTSNRASGRPGYDVTLASDKVPVASLFNLLHEAKKELPADLAATGLLDGEFHAVSNGVEPTQFTGSATATDVKLSSNGGRETVTFSSIPLVVADARCCNHGHSRATLPSQVANQGAVTKEAEPIEAHLRIGPTALQVNASAPVNTGGWVSAAGYRFYLRGDTELKNLFRLETALGLPAVRPAAEGFAKLDVSVSGAWQGLAPPNALGTAQLRNVRAETRGFNSPIEIASATVLLGPDKFSVQKLSAQTGTTHWSGSVTAPRRCAPACMYQFDLAADQLSAQDLAEWLTPHTAKRPWYRILSSNDLQGPSPLRALQAHGTLHVARLDLKKVSVTQVATHLDLERAKLVLTDLRAQLLHGTHQGNWTIDASSPPLHYHGAGTLQNIALAQVATVMGDDWIRGSADATFDLETAGGSFPDLLATSKGSLQFVMRSGSLTHVELPESEGPLPVHRFTGSLRLKENSWQLIGGKLESRDGFYQVSGTAGPDSGLDFVLTRGDDQSWNLTGTLSRLTIAPASPTEISREETPAKTEAKP